MARCNNGDYDGAIACLKEEMEFSGRLGDKVWRCRILNTFSWVYIDLCDWDIAIQYNTQGAAESQELGEPEIIRNAEINMADCHLAQGNLDEAQRLLDTVRRESQDSGNLGEAWMKWRYMQHFHHSLGELWLARGDAKKAIAFADECLAVAVDTNSRRNIVKGRRLKGEAFLAQGKFAEADMELTEALHVAHEVGNPAQLWKTYAILGHLRRAQGQSQEALAAYRDAISVIEGVASRLSDASLRETMLNSPQVTTLRELVREGEEK